MWAFLAAGLQHWAKHSLTGWWKEEVKCLVVMARSLKDGVDLVKQMVCVTYCVWAIVSIFSPSFLCVLTSELRGCMSNSVELCPMPSGMPAVRYMAPTARLFLASLAAFISSTVSPSSAKICSPALARAPSSHNRKWRVWLTAMGRKETQKRRQE